MRSSIHGKEKGVVYKKMNIALPIVAVVLSPCISFFVYHIAQRRMKAGESGHSRAHLFYRMISGITIGQFFGHIVCNPLLAGPGMLGYALAYVLETIMHCCYPTPPENQVDSDADVDPLLVKTREAVYISDPTDPTQIEGAAQLQYTIRLTTKRCVILAVFMIILSVLSLTDALALASRLGASAPDPMLIISYLIHSASLSCVIYSVMLHAKLHTISDDRLRLLVWGLLTFFWTMVLVGSAIESILGVVTPPRNATGTQVLFAVYGLAAGIMLRLQQYFDNMKTADITMDRKQLTQGVIVFICAAGQAMITAIWL